MFLVFCLSITYLPISSFAEQNVNREFLTVVDLGVTYERIIKDGTVTVIARSLDGDIINTIKNIDGKVYLDNKLIFKSNELNIDQHLMNDLITDIDATDNKLSIGSFAPDKSTLRSINWGPWNNSSLGTIKTGGFGAAVIAGFILVLCPYVGIQLIAVVAGAAAGMYEEIEVKVKIRYGVDGQYQYYERYTYFYGDGELITVPGNPFFDTGKTPL